MLDFGNSKSYAEVSKSNKKILVESYFFPFLQREQLSIACYQVSLYANILFE